MIILKIWISIQTWGKADLGFIRSDLFLVFDFLMFHIIISVMLTIYMGLILKKCKWVPRCAGFSWPLFALREAEEHSESCRRYVIFLLDWALCCKTNKKYNRINPFIKTDSRFYGKHLSCLLILQGGFFYQRYFVVSYTLFLLF